MMASSSQTHNNKQTEGSSAVCLLAYSDELMEVSTEDYQLKFSRNVFRLWNLKTDG